MALEPGRYDGACEQALKATKAHSIVLIVMDGEKGHGFSCMSYDPLFNRQLPEILRATADALDEDLRKVHNPVNKQQQQTTETDKHEHQN